VLSSRNVPTLRRQKLPPPYGFEPRNAIAIFQVSAAVPCTNLNDSTGLERNLQRQYKASNVFVGYVANYKVDNKVSQPNELINF